VQQLAGSERGSSATVRGEERRPQFAIGVCAKVCKQYALSWSRLVAFGACAKVASRNQSRRCRMAAMAESEWYIAFRLETI
jgi:hypothetical protein